MRARFGVLFDFRWQRDSRLRHTCCIVHWDQTSARTGPWVGSQKLFIELAVWRRGWARLCFAVAFFCPRFAGMVGATERNIRKHLNCLNVGRNWSFVSGLRAYKSSTPFGGFLHQQRKQARKRFCSLGESHMSCKAGVCLAALAMMAIRIRSTRLPSIVLRHLVVGLSPSMSSIAFSTRWLVKFLPGAFLGETDENWYCSTSTADAHFRTSVEPRACSNASTAHSLVGL